MSGPLDLTLVVGEGPKALSLFLADMASYFRGERRSAAGDVIVPRFLAKLFEMSFAEAAARTDALEETSRAYLHVERRVADLQAEVSRLVDERFRRPAATVVSLVPTPLRREPARAAEPPTGGAS